VAWKNTRSLALGIVAAAALAAPAAADWLVLRDGSRVETRGTWENRGATVVFHRPNGVLASLRLSDVDLDASTAATAAAVEEAQRPKTPVAPPPPRPVIASFTDADFTQVEVPFDGASSEEAAAAAPAEPDPNAAPAGDPAAPGSTSGDSAAGEAAAAAPAAPAVTAANRIQVVDWREDTDSATSGSVTIVGDLHNASPEFALQVSLTVFLLDEDGGVLATSEALVGAAALKPNQRTNFRASFPGVGRYSSVKFEARHHALASAETPPG
jgi:hypothetical protein